MEQVYHGTTLFQYLFLKELGFLGEMDYQYILEEYLGRENGDSRDFGFFMTVDVAEAVSYAQSAVSMFSRKLKNPDQLTTDDDYLKFLKLVGINLGDPLVVELLTTPVIMKIPLGKAYAQSLEKPVFMVGTQVRMADADKKGDIILEVIAPYPPLNIQAVELILASS